MAVDLLNVFDDVVNEFLVVDGGVSSTIRFDGDLEALEDTHA